ncbi:MAG: FAD/NAD(P)-binding protein [Acidimicrobiales bacterium]
MSTDRVIAGDGGAVATSSRQVMTPIPHRVIESVRETSDVTTLLLEPLEGPLMRFRCGQFNMLSAFGVGEIAVSHSGAPSERPLRHSIRDVGAVSRALCQRRVGDLVGVRGPFGTDWQIDTPSDGSTIDDRDTVVVAGGVGLAPLRGAVEELTRARAYGGGRVFVMVGAREPSQIVFGADLSSWAARGASVALTVDRAAPGWDGKVGLVTSLLADAGFDLSKSRALLCGPEIMMRFTARALVDLGLNPEAILVSLERNMQCGVGWCGHCQLGPFLLCRDGPVVPYAGLVSQLLTQRER